ncbi:hypothetical protein HYX11_04315 [Candidatus Woesearchaeota archaeon]|nr:hypothetical protein [Candidatus Woesearchaeota archaeon]
MTNKNYASQSSLGNYQPRTSYQTKAAKYQPLTKYNPQELAGYNKSYLPIAQKGINFGLSAPAGYFKAPKQGLEKQLGNESGKSGDNKGGDLLRLLGSNTYSPGGYAILIIYQPLANKDAKGLDVKDWDKNNLAHLIEQELAQLNFQVQHV